jgi:hypothetical protein
MGNFIPTTPIQLQIRKIIFENHNDADDKFTNDEVFEKIKQNGDLDPSWIIDDIESYFHNFCDSGLVRNIAQILQLFGSSYLILWRNVIAVLVIQMCILGYLKNKFVQTLLVNHLFRSVFDSCIF